MGGGVIWKPELLVFEPNQSRFRLTQKTKPSQQTLKDAFKEQTNKWHMARSVLRAGGSVCLSVCLSRTRVSQPFKATGVTQFYYF